MRIKPLLAALPAVLLLLSMPPETLPASPLADDGPPPIKALLVCGGCCHDYEHQKHLIADGLAERARIDVTVVHQGGTSTDSKIPLYQNPDWAKGYDIVIHDECFSGVGDRDWVNTILKPHADGLPAVVLHCAMHSYRTGDDRWFQFLGVTSRRHGAAYGHEVLNIDASHPIMKSWGPAWQNPAGELYWIEKVWPSAHPLATSKNQEKGNDEVCVWTNDYHGTRVFGTTLGHHNETVRDPKYLELLTNGVLWACGKLDKSYLKTVGPKQVPVNAAEGKTASASSEETGKNNLARNATDGQAGTRWCASGPNKGEWLSVDLGAPTNVSAVEIDWEQPSARYQYRVEGSSDGKSWKTLLDASHNTTETSPNLHKLSAPGTRFVRVTYLGSSSGGWGSIRELRVFNDQTRTIDPSADQARHDQKVLSDVKIPDGYDVSLFAEPPAANYPVYVAAAPDGTLYVSSDKNGSLDRKPLRGSVLRLRDLDHDGHADEVKRFVPNVDSPRGLVFDHDRVYLMHPPHLSAFIDDDGDGVSDREQVLVKNIAFTFKDRPADHTSNGVTLGIDGWLYLAIGDFGFMQAEGADGRKLQLRGGGVVRVRPDGSGLEIFSRGTRNILEVGLDGLLNAFARDNTNDGGGWDIRLHHFSGGEHHGYPSLFKNFTDEAVAPLADYGGGSGCGALYLDEPGFPASDSPALYTADWGRERVYQHHLTPLGATFSADQSVFIRLPRVTDLDVDASSHLYLSSWKGATFTYVGENVGYLIRVTPKGAKPAPLPDFDALDGAALVSLLTDPSHRRRLKAQRTLLRKGLVRKQRSTLESLASDTSKPLTARVAALFALIQALGQESHAYVITLAADPSIREYALRALADHPQDGADVPSEVFTSLVLDPSPRVRLQAVRGLARLNRQDAAPAVASALSDSDPIVAHTAVRALVSLHAIASCLAILDQSDAPASARVGALRALERIHDPKVVAALIARLNTEKDPARRLGLESALARLVHREGPWKGDSWGTRPDTSGPYYQPEEWSESATIMAALKQALDHASGDEAAGLVALLSKNKVKLGMSLDRVLRMAQNDPGLIPAAVSQLASTDSIPPVAVPILISAATHPDTAPATRSKAVQALVHTPGAPSARATLSALVLLSKLKNQPEFQQARQAFLNADHLGDNVETWKSVAEQPEGPLSQWADVALLETASAPSSSPEARAVASKALDAGWSSKKRRLQILQAIRLSGDRKLADRLRLALADTDPQIQKAARNAAKALRLDLKPRPPHTGPKIETLPIDSVLAEAVKTTGDLSEGESLFTSLSCVNCHTVRQDEPARGPYLGTIATTYKRPELAEAILRPSKTLAQGFVTNIFALDDGRTLTGFVTREAADSVTIRTSDAREFTIPTASIEQRAKSETSVMPEGLVNTITVEELSSLLDYLESLSQKK